MLVSKVVKTLNILITHFKAPIVLSIILIVKMIAGEHFLSYTCLIYGSLEILKVGDIHKYIGALYVFSHKRQFIRIHPNPYTTRENCSIALSFSEIVSNAEFVVLYYGLLI